MTENEKNELKRSTYAVTTVATEVEQFMTAFSSQTRRFYDLVIRYGDDKDGSEITENGLKLIISALDSLQTAATTGGKTLAKRLESFVAAKNAAKESK